jgi:hypothetical protein
MVPVKPGAKLIVSWFCGVPTDAIAIASRSVVSAPPPLSASDVTVIVANKWRPSSGSNRNSRDE